MLLQDQERLNHIIKELQTVNEQVQQIKQDCFVQLILNHENDPDDFCYEIYQNNKGVIVTNWDCEVLIQEFCYYLEHSGK